MLNGRHSSSLVARLSHVALSCALSIASIVVGGILAKNSVPSLFSFEVLFGHGLFVALVFPAYCVFFYWATYPLFRVSPASESGPRLPALTANPFVSNTSSILSIVFSLVGFAIPPVALIGIIVGHLTRIRLRAVGSSAKGRLALVGLILGHVSLSMWVAIFVDAFILRPR